MAVNDDKEIGREEVITSGSWSWNVAVAARRLSQAEDAFQALVQGALPPIDEHDVAEAPSQEDDAGNKDEKTSDARANTAATVLASIKTKSFTKRKNGSPENNLSTPPRKNRFIPPHRRPRHTRALYRLSPLEAVDDEKLIPRMKMEDVASAIPAAVQRERLFEQHPLPLLLRKRLWCYDGLDYEEEHPMGAYCGGAEDVTPDDWAEDGVDDDSSDANGDVNGNNEGTGKTNNKPWPRGTPYDASVFTLCWNYFLFTYGKAKQASNKVILWGIIASFVSPACSYLFGTGLIDELNDQTSRGQTEQERLLYSSLFAVAILALRTFASYLTTQPYHCGYSVNGAPTGFARAGLRDTLFHRMRHSKSTLNNKITPGGASGIIVDKVFGE